MCFTPLFTLLVYWQCRGGFRPFLLIRAYSSFRLFKTGIYRPSGTPMKLLIDKVKSDFTVKKCYESHIFLLCIFSKRAERNQMFSRFLFLSLVPLNVHYKTCGSVLWLTLSYPQK